MRWPGFIGPSYVHRSVNVDAERTINLYPEIVDGGAMGKNRVVLRGTPGLQRFAQLPNGPVRCLWAMDGRCFAAGPSQFYEVFAGGTVTSRGTIQTDGRPVTVSSSGTQGYQLLVTSGGQGYIFDLKKNTLTRISDRDFPRPVVSALFLDSFFVALKGQSRQFYFSEQLDGSKWNGADVAETQVSADNLRAMASSHRELWLFGSYVTHVWVLSGDLSSQNVFVPISGVFIEHGCLAPYSIVNLDNTLYWLGQDKDGAGQVWRANGYTPERVSTHAVEYHLKKQGNLEDCVGWSYSEEGHSFLCLYVPGGETTFCYDAATGLWHERGIWDEQVMDWTPHAGRCHCSAFGKHLVGDRQTGMIYEMSLSLLADDTTAVSP